MVQKKSSLNNVDKNYLFITVLRGRGRVRILAKRTLSCAIRILTKRTRACDLRAAEN
jgi:hypothetical protein